MEFKNFEIEVKATDEQDGIGTFKAYGSTFGNIDRVGDRVMPGAFKSAKAKSTLLLWQHNTNEVIGGFTDMHEDDKGLFVEGELNLDVQRGREAYSLLKRRHINSLSIGYTIPKNGASIAPDGIRELKKVNLAEISLVSIPANPKALIRAVKSDVGVTIREFEQSLKSEFTRSEIEKITRIAKSQFAFEIPDERDAVGNDNERDAVSTNQEILSKLHELRDAFDPMISLISK